MSYLKNIMQLLIKPLTVNKTLKFKLIDIKTLTFNFLKFKFDARGEKSFLPAKFHGVVMTKLYTKLYNTFKIYINGRGRNIIFLPFFVLF